jgi:hypothetical protein
MTDFAQYMEAVARDLLGAPNTALSTRTELRFGSRGSMSVRLDKGVWHDHEHGRSGGVLDLIKYKTGKTGTDATDYIQSLGCNMDDGRKGNGPEKSPQGDERPKLGDVWNLRGTLKTIERIYHYYGPGGEYRFEVLRFKPKDFRQGHVSNLKFIGSITGIKQVPYRLPQLKEAIARGYIVYMCEGEKDAESLASLGLCATTNAGGASNFRDELIPYFEGADVVLVPHRDPAGDKHTRTIVSKLTGVAKRIRVLELWHTWPEMPVDGGDVTNWLEAGHDEEELDRLVQTLPEWEPPASISVHSHGEEEMSANRSWAIDKLVPETGVGLISGQWGMYKTFAAIDMALALAADAPFLDHGIRRRGATLFIAAEGAFDVPLRVEAAVRHKYGHVYELPSKPAPFNWTDTCPPLLAKDSTEKIVETAKWVDKKMRKKHGLPLALVFIDTIGMAAGYNKAGDENDAAVGLALMSSLTEISKQTGTFVFAIDHFGKDTSTGTRGTSAKEAGADVVLALIGDRTLAGAISNMRLAVRKNRAGRIGDEYSFQIKVVPVGQDEYGEVTSLIVEWGKGMKSVSEVKGGGKIDPWKSAPLKALRLAIIDAEVSMKNKKVDVDVVRINFDKHYPVDGDPAAKQVARRQAWKRARETAMAKGLVAHEEDDRGRTMIWFVEKE